MKKLLIILAVVGALAAFGIYKLVNSFGEAGEVGDKAMTAFHTEFNAHRIAAIHAGAAPAFRTSVPLADFTTLTDLLHEKLGQWKSGERTGIHMSNNSGNKSLELTCSAKFEKGEGTEEFIYDYNGDQPLLMGYNVKSPALIEKVSRTPAAPAEPEEAPLHPEDNK